MRLSIEERFMKYVEPVTESGCWIWIGALQGKGINKGAGYGSFSINSKTTRAHRVSYELFIGKIPDGLTLDHLCKVHCCVNPYHLEPVTSLENCKRADIWKHYRNKTHCKYGHPYQGDNLYVNPRGERQCRTCSNERTRQWRLRRDN